MLTLVLEGAIMLRLNMHVNSTLILLGEITVRALEVSRLCADIIEGHCGTNFYGVQKFNFLAPKINHNFRMVCMKKVRIQTRELQGVLESYIKQGFLYVTRIYPNVPSKFPTVGCIVELSHYCQQGSFPIHSIKGQQLIHRISYM